MRRVKVPYIWKSCLMIQVHAGSARWRLAAADLRLDTAGQQLPLRLSNGPCLFVKLRCLFLLHSFCAKRQLDMKGSSANDSNSLFAVTSCYINIIRIFVAISVCLECFFFSFNPVHQKPSCFAGQAEMDHRPHI